MLIEIISYYIDYPLPNHFELFGIKIAYYGLIITIGFYVATRVFEKKIAQKYFDEILNPFFYLFIFVPAIVGAKFFDDFFLTEYFTFKNFFSIENFRGGGLSIYGGILSGLLGFLLYFVLFRPKVLIRDLLDIMVPCILIGQAIGRWGNFFNCEIYGEYKFAFNNVWWLPNIIKRQMSCCGDITNKFRFVPLPLFLIESIINLIGYFVIKIVDKKFHKNLSKGDLCCLYFVWYSSIRILLEFLRSKENAGGYHRNNIITSILILITSLLTMIILHIYDFLRWNKYTFQVTKNNFCIKNPYYENNCIVNGKNQEVL